MVTTILFLILKILFSYVIYVYVTLGWGFALIWVRTQTSFSIDKFYDFITTLSGVLVAHAWSLINSAMEILAR